MWAQVAWARPGIGPGTAHERTTCPALPGAGTVTSLPTTGHRPGRWAGAGRGTLGRSVSHGLRHPGAIHAPHVPVGRRRKLGLHVPSAQEGDLFLRRGPPWWWPGAMNTFTFRC